MTDNPPEGHIRTDPIKWTCSVCGEVIRKPLDVTPRPAGCGLGGKPDSVAVNIVLPRHGGREMLAGESHNNKE